MSVSQRGLLVSTGWGRRGTGRGGEGQWSAEGERRQHVSGRGPRRAAEGGGGAQLLSSRARGPPGPGDTQRQVVSQPSHSLRWGWGFSSMALGSVCPGFRMFWKALWHPGSREVGVCPLGCLLGLNVVPGEAGLCRPWGAGGDSMNPAGLWFLASYPGGLGPGGCFLGSGRAPTGLPGPQPCGLCQAVVGDRPPPPRPTGEQRPGQVTLSLAFPQSEMGENVLLWIFVKQQRIV